MAQPGWTMQDEGILEELFWTCYERGVAPTLRDVAETLSAYHIEEGDAPTWLCVAMASDDSELAGPLVSGWQQWTTEAHWNAWLTTRHTVWLQTIPTFMDLDEQDFEQDFDERGEGVDAPPSNEDLLRWVRAEHDQGGPWAGEDALIVTLDTWGLTETQARTWIAWLTPEQRHTLLPTTSTTTTIAVAPAVAVGVAGGGEWSGDDQAWFVDFLTALDKGTYEATPKGLYRFVTDEAADAADDDWMDEAGHASAESDGLAPSAHAWLEKALQRLPAALQARTSPATSHTAPASGSSTGQDSVPAWNTWTSWNKTDTQALQTFLTGIQSGLYEATLADADLYLTAQNPYQDFELRRGVRAWHWLGNAKTHSTYINSIRRNALSPEPANLDGDNWLAWLVTAAAEAWDETDEGLLHTFLDTTTNAQTTPTLDDLQHFLDEQIPSDHPPRAGRWIHQARYSSPHAKTIITNHPDTTPTSTKASAWLTYLCNPTGPARPLPTTSNDGPPANRRRTHRARTPAVDLTTLNPQAVQAKLNRLGDYRRWVVSGLMQGHDSAQIGVYRRYRTQGGGTDTAVNPTAMGNQIVLIGKALGLGRASEALRVDLVALGIGDPGTYDADWYVAAHAREENDDAYVAKANTISADPTSPHRWFLSAILHGHNFKQIHQTLQADGTRKGMTYVRNQVDNLAVALGMPPDYTTERARATLLRLKSRINDPLTYSTAARDLDAASSSPTQ